MKKIIVIMSVIIAAIIIGIVLITYHKDEPDITETATKVGVIMNGSRTDRSWNQAHYEALCETAEKLNLDITYKESVIAEDVPGIIDGFVDEGCEIVIACSFEYGEYMVEAADKYPEIFFFHATGTESSKNMSSYFGRMYQMRYLTGIAAGLQTETNEIGYVAAFPISEVNRGINAFTLGVKSVNPDATVYVSFTDSWDNEEREIIAAEKLIKEKSTDVMTYHQNQHYVAKTADENGVYSIGYNETAEGLSDKYLTAAVWDWESLYFQIIREFVQGQPNSVERRWFSIDTGVVGLSEISPVVSEETKQKVENAKNNLYISCDVFSGKIYDNEGVLRCDENETLSDETLLRDMNWFVEGVEIYGEES